MTSNDFKNLVKVFERDDIKTIHLRRRIVYIFRLRKVFYADIKKTIDRIVRKHGIQ